MQTMNTPQPGPPAARPPNPEAGKGFKYALVREILGGIEPSAWIRHRRHPEDPDTYPMSYSAIAEELNKVIRAKSRGTQPASLRVTHESIRRWDEDGVFYAQAQERAADPTGEGEAPKA